MTNSADAAWLAEIEGALTSDPINWAVALEQTLSRFGAVVGTVHRIGDGGLLELLEHRGLPEVLLPKVERIPVGKGMAGLAAERREPVQVCNLQSDDSGVAKPDAKLTQMEGSISLPCLDGEVLVGTLGVAKPVPHEYDAEELRLLEAAAALYARVLNAGG